MIQKQAQRGIKQIENRNIIRTFMSRLLLAERDFFKSITNG